MQLITKNDCVLNKKVGVLISHYLRCTSWFIILSTGFCLHPDLDIDGEFMCNWKSKGTSSMKPGFINKSYLILV